MRDVYKAAIHSFWGNLYGQLFYSVKKPNRKIMDKKLGDSGLIFTDVLNDFRRYGLAVVPGYYSRHDSLRLKREIDNRFHENYDSKFYWQDSVGSDERIFGAELLSEEIHAFHTDSTLRELCECYLGVRIRNSCTLMARARFKPHNKGSGGGWHRDSNSKQVKAIVFLSDITEKQGPFTFIQPKIRNQTSLWSLFHRYGRGAALRFSDIEIAQLERDRVASKRSILVSAGTVVLVDTSCIHRGMPILSGSRYALFNYYLPQYRNIREFRKKVNAVEIG